MDSGEDDMSHSSFMPRQMSYASIDTAASESQDMIPDAESGKAITCIPELTRYQQTNKINKF